MKPLSSFVSKFSSLISWDLSCFDRVIFKGHLPFSYPAAFEKFVDYTLNIRRADFMETVAPAWSEQLVDHAKAFAAQSDRPYEYHQGDLACNQRYLDELTAVDDPTPGYDDLKKLTEPKREQGRSYAGFNPARQEEVRLFTAVLAGDHIAKGMRNKENRLEIYGPVKDKRRRQRQSAAVGRLQKRLHVRGMVKKVPRTRLWRVTERG